MKKGKNSHCASQAGLYHLIKMTEGPGSKGPVIFAAEKGCREVHEALKIEGETMEIVSLKDLGGGAGRLSADLIIVDCGLELERGLRVLRNIKQSCPDIPILFISDDYSDRSVEVLRAGARGHFIKPVDIIEMQELVRNLLFYKRHSAEKRSPLVLARPQEEVRLKATTDKPLNFLRVVQYINENLSEGITLDELAREAGLTKYHFCRFFSRHTGMSPMRFISFLKVGKAKELIKNGAAGGNLVLIAVQSGFGNYSTFFKQFKRFTGCTPKEYMSSLRPS